MVTYDNWLFYEPEDSFWVGIDRLGFEASNLLGEWPLSKNHFIHRMAGDLVVGRVFSQFAVADIKSLVGYLVRIEPQSVYRFRFNSDTTPGLRVELISAYQGFEVPFRADNACSFEVAVAWLRSRRKCFDISFTAGANFWVHRDA